MNDVTKNLNEFSKWEPQQKDIDWMEKFIQDSLKKANPFIWASSNFSLQIEQDNKDVILKDINFNHEENPEASFENLSRSVKVLEKLGYRVVSAGGVVLNMHKTERVLDGRHIQKRL